MLCGTGPDHIRALRSAIDGYLDWFPGQEEGPGRAEAHGEAIDPAKGAREP